MSAKIKYKFRDLEEAWHDYCTSVLKGLVPGRAIIRSEEDGQRPAKPYVTIKIATGGGTKGFDEIRLKEYNALPGKVLHDLVGHRQFVVEFKAFAPSVNRTVAGDIIELIQTNLDNPLENDSLKASKPGIAIVNRGVGQDITVALETGLERRNFLSVTFNATQALEIEPSVIEKASVSGTLTTNGANQRIIPPFLVPEDP